RSGRDADAAVEALVSYAARYERALTRSRMGFVPPTRVSGVTVAERVKGNGTTDFGAPGIAPAADERPLDDAETERQVRLLRAAWAALDRAAAAAAGAALRTGPRGGGRQVEAIVTHVADAEGAYLSKLGGRAVGGADPREVIVETIGTRARGEPPARTPRSGVLWTPRYFVRRAAWHALDHAWEIEDRAPPEG
ncbi:MAG TPA: hypothetical protein VLX89_03020, partial [Actinomycetota bacterium]|nr:hypothetical protein [Actinomycetota bacterium]